MRKLLLIVTLLFPALVFGQKKKPLPKTYDLLIGTYTTGKSKGIYVYRFYAETGKMAYLNEIDGVDNPSYLTVSENHKFVYAVNETGKKGEVSAFKFEPNTGKLEFINKQSSGGADPCYVSEDRDQKNIFIANYSSGTLGVLKVNKDGSLNPPSQVLQDEGSGPNKDRQAQPHVHTAVLSPDEKYLLYTDLGTDKLNVMRYHSSADKPLTPATTPFVSVTAGYGPRHLVFSNDKKYLYLLQEMGSAINTYSYDNGKLKQLQSVTMLADGFSGQTGAAAIHISPDGKFLYASNRLETNEITTYAINQETGELNFVARQATFGKNPRDFAIDPTGNFMVVGNQGSDNVLIFKIDKNTGKLRQTGAGLEIGNPVCFKFVPAE